jgi:hypothetical protein
MSIFLILCVLAAAGWLLLSVSNRDSADRPDASVAAYSRAMAALSPESDAPLSPRQPVRRAPARATRPRQRPRHAAAGRRPHPAAARTATRR